MRNAVSLVLLTILQSHFVMAEMEICLNTQQYGAYQSPRGKIEVRIPNNQPLSYDLSYSRDQFDIIHYYFTAYSEGIYEIYYVETLLGWETYSEKLETYKTINGTLILTEEISISSYNATARNAIILDPGFYVSGSTTVFTTEFNNCGLNYRANYDYSDKALSFISNKEMPNVKFYPNPNFDKKLNIDVFGLDFPAKISIINTLGNVCFEQIIHENTSLNLPPDLVSGIYLVELISAKGVRSVENVIFK